MGKHYDERNEVVCSGNRQSSFSTQFRRGGTSVDVSMSRKTAKEIIPTVAVVAVAGGALAAICKLAERR